jgi:hypothetical protein
MIDQFERCGFSRAAAAEQNDGFPATDLKTEVLQNATFTETIGNVAKLNGRTIVASELHDQGLSTENAQGTEAPH